MSRNEAFEAGKAEFNAVKEASDAKEMELVRNLDAEGSRKHSKNNFNAVYYPTRTPDPASAKLAAQGEDASPFDKWIMMGDNPAGITAAKVRNHGVTGTDSVGMYKGKKHVGQLDMIGSKIDNIQTHSDEQRKGIATGMLKLANFFQGRGNAEGPIQHGDVRTPSGDAFAKSTGDPVPQRIPSFGINGSRLRDLK